MLYKDDKHFAAKFVAYISAIIGSLFVGAWAGPLGLILWLVLSSTYLYTNGLTWAHLEFCFLVSFGLAMLVYWIRSDQKMRDKERRKRVMVARCKRCGNITEKKVVYLRE